jgi:hypothetical protein
LSKYQFSDTLLVYGSSQQPHLGRRPRHPERVYLTRLWNLATWDEWTAARKRYSPADFEAVVRHPLRGHWTRHGKAFAETLCGISMPPDVLAAYDA